MYPASPAESSIANLKVAVTHTNFALYWRARLEALDRLLRAAGAELHVIEVTGDAGPYDFSRTAAAGGWSSRHHRLFDCCKIESIGAAEVVRRVHGALDAVQPDVVIAGAIAFSPGAAAVNWCARHRRGVVVMDTARHEDVRRGALVNGVKRRFYAHVDAVLIPASSHAMTYEDFGFGPHQIFYGVDAVDNDCFAVAAAEARARGIDRIGEFTFPRPFFLGVGRQVPKKNWPMLVDAYARYRGLGEHPIWDLVLVGDGPDHASIKARAHGLNGVHLLPFLTPEQMPMVYANAGCAILPSHYGETWGLVINEAMACGLPVLVSRECGCAPSLVESGGNGWTFAPDEPDEIVKALLAMTRLDNARRRAMGERSRQIVARWSLERFANAAWHAVRIAACRPHHGASWIDRILLSAWKGRFRPT